MSKKVEKLRADIAKHMEEAFDLATELSNAGETTANTLRQQLIATCEMMRGGKDAANRMRAKTLGSTRTITNSAPGVGVTRKRAGAKPYSTAQKAEELSEAPAHQTTTRHTPPPYEVQEVDPIPPVVDETPTDTTEGKTVEGTEEVAETPTEEGLNLTEMDAALPDGLTVATLASSEAGELAGAYKVANLKNLLSIMGAPKTSSRSRAALSKRVVSHAQTLMG